MSMRAFPGKEDHLHIFAGVTKLRVLLIDALASRSNLLHFQSESRSRLIVEEEEGVEGCRSQKG
jgi:hypothetical protein